MRRGLAIARYATREVDVHIINVRGHVWTAKAVKRVCIAKKNGIAKYVMVVLFVYMDVQDTHAKNALVIRYVCIES
jgi:hypothetical protein